MHEVWSDATDKPQGGAKRMEAGAIFFVYMIPIFLPLSICYVIQRVSYNLKARRCKAELAEYKKANGYKGYFSRVKLVERYLEERRSRFIF